MAVLYFLQPAQATIRVMKRIDASDLPQIITGTSGTFDQLVNPNDPGDRTTFRQRTYIDSSYAVGSGAPVIYLMPSEGEMSARAAAYYAQIYAKPLHAHFVAIEHRFYGKSQPYGDLSSEHLKTLTLSVALDDLARFQRHLMAEKDSKFQGKWIAIGGSYSGALAAFYRLRFPHLVAGALASSAPVFAKPSFEETDEHALTVLSPQCAAAVRMANQIAEDAYLGDPGKFSAILKTFDAEDIRDPIDFINILSDVSYWAVQYGSHEEFCEGLDADDPALMQKYAKRMSATFQRYMGPGTRPIDDSFQIAETTNPSDYSKPVASFRSWYYQSCSQFGWFPIGGVSADSLKSKFVTLEYMDTVCQRLYGIPVTRNTGTQNQEFYELLLAPSTSHILFTNGEHDPWSRLSISHELGNDTNPNTAVYRILGGSHCSDISMDEPGDNESLRTSRSLFRSLALSWLK